MSETDTDEEHEVIDLESLISLAQPGYTPGTFKLMGHEITIYNIPGLIEIAGAFGLWFHKDLVIMIDPDVPASQYEHALFHEITHAMLDLTGHMKLSTNERFVDCIGGALGQVISTLNRTEMKAKRKAKRAKSSASTES